MIYFDLCTKYELICSFNTFCTCIHSYYVQTTYRTTYEFHFQLGFSRREQAVTSLRSSLAARRPGERSLYLSGVLQGGDSFDVALATPVAVRDVTRSFPAARRSGEHSLYISGVLRVGDPVLYVIYCHFCTKYELICSFNTFYTCIHPYYVQKTYKTTYEFHFQLGFSRRVRSVTSLRSFPLYLRV